jgi:hypothetical protein
VQEDREDKRSCGVSTIIPALYIPTIHRGSIFPNVASGVRRKK